MKNTTLNRKPKEEMVKGAGEYRPRKTASQAGDGADFAFNGQMGDGVNRSGNRHAGNAYGHLVKNADSINEGMKSFARTGNHSDQSVDRMEKIGPSATKDALKQTISRASEGHNVGRMSQPGKFANPDAINVGMK